MSHLAIRTSSLSEIANRSMLGFGKTAQGLSSTVVITQTSLYAGAITTGFNSELNGFLSDLTAKRIDLQQRVDAALKANPSFKELRGSGVSLAWEFEYNGTDLLLLPYSKIEQITKEYAYLKSDFVFGLANSDPYFVKDGMVYTCYHGDENPDLEFIANSFDDFLKQILEVL